MKTELSREWMNEAACSGLSTRVFFVNAGRQPALAGLAISLCHTCPVQYQCYCYALLRGEHGIWGGTTEEERFRLRPLVNKNVLDFWWQIVSEYVG